MDSPKHFLEVERSRKVTFLRIKNDRVLVLRAPDFSNPLGRHKRGDRHLILDGDQARSTFVISTGLIEPSATLTVFFTSSRELATLPNGGMHVFFPSVLTPLVVAVPESESETGSLCDDSSTSCFGSASLKSDPSFYTPPKEPDIFRGDVYNPFPYEFSFEMLVNGPCLLAGLESPSHALRADANPYASSASTICITLADKHRYDKNLEIILHPSDGAMTYHEYEVHIRNRWDYARIAKKDSDGERQIAFVQKRFHKDIFYNPVLMLNFCPRISSVSTDIQTDALLVAIKSLPSSSLLNVAGFGPNIRPAFKTSKPCNNKLRADVSGTSLLAALNWSLGQPLHRGYPRQLFILTDSSVENPGKVIELVRRQASTVRCFTFGLGSAACHQLLRRLAKVSRGQAEFLSAGERLQPKLIKSLKKAIEPAVSDITIDWYVPDTMEALLSPNEIAALYPGDRLISYCTLYHIASFRDKKATLRRNLANFSKPVTINYSPWQVEILCLEETSGSGFTSLPTSRSNMCLLTAQSALTLARAYATALPAVSIALSSEELMRKKKALAKTAMSGRSFSSPHGELDSRRLRRALEKVSQKPNRSLEGKLDEIGPELQKKPQAAADSSNLLSPVHLDWDMLLDPPYLFSPSPALEQGMADGNSLPPLQCQVVIHALSAGKPVSWEVIGGLDSLFLPKDSLEHSQGWQQQNPGLEKLLHHLTAASVIRDNETVAQREAEVEHGFFRRFRLKAVQLSGQWRRHGLALRPQCLSPESELSSGCDSAIHDYLPLAFSEAVQIPLDRLCRASPYPSHRASLSPASSTSPWALIAKNARKPPANQPPPEADEEGVKAQGMEPDSPHSPSTCSDVLSAVVWAQADSGRGSETDVCDHSPAASEASLSLQEAGLEAEEGDLESTSWATAVALAWLEHRSAGFFVEWELLAAKADSWLRGQPLPEGLDVAALKGAARQLFLLLRHWDENIKLNMLCYNPNDV
ncbi:hypothetical protein Chor_014478 [Crotalus horridus]